ncbi:MAG: hypothetical protein LBS65_09360, partial [Desulfovibrio sp.]|nr:hypothetical protein [Desulfovibrio sp.]
DTPISPARNRTGRRPVPPELKVRTGATVTIYLPKTVIATLEKVAQKTGKTKSGVAAEAVLDKYAT